MKSNKYYIALLLAVGSVRAATPAVTNRPPAIPWSDIGAKAGADYQGDGLAVTSTESGARLHCVFQRLDGEATTEGLWLTSTVSDIAGDRFQVIATTLKRKVAGTTLESQELESSAPLACGSIASVDRRTVRFGRPGLQEEYSVSMDGVRQDFIVEQPPSSPTEGELVIGLAVSGARAERAAYGARLVLEKSGRRIAYGRLRVTDATGKNLPARLEVCPVESRATSPKSWANKEGGCGGDSFLPSALARADLEVVVNDCNAVYPVRVDPTFSDVNWVSMGDFPGTDGVVYAVIADPSGNVYLGGTFTIVGNAMATNVAKWNGSSWSGLGPGIGRDENHVNALAVSGDTLYAGGVFDVPGGSVANYIAQWDGSGWSQLGDGTDGEVYALAMDEGTLYVGGSFDAVYDGLLPIVAGNIARWNGSNWSPLGSGMDDSVYSLVVSSGTLYAGGLFTEAGGRLVRCVAQWDGSAWSALGSGVGGAPSPYVPFVSALAASGGMIYAGGYFTNMGGLAANCVAQWDGRGWSPLGAGVAGGDQYGPRVSALVASGGALFAAGDFTTAGARPARGIAQWDGRTWSALASGINGAVNALTVSRGTLYAVGDFTTAGGIPAFGIAPWNGKAWSAPGSGINGIVDALAVSGGALYAGGNFTGAGGVAANCIARWNGGGWSPLGLGMSGGEYYSPHVSALAVSGGTLYAGGSFTVAGGSPANYIAQWDGATWSPLGSGLGGVEPYTSVSALAVSGGMLYVGGTFTTAGGVPANYVAQWNGTNWSPLGEGINGPVYALAASGGLLYAGSAALGYIAQWDGSSWSQLAGGTDAEVDALAVSGGLLYAGGQFATAGGNPANYIALWDGTKWSALGSGIDYPVSALATSGGTLYAAGVSTGAGSSLVGQIAQWNGSSWSPVSSGMNSSVFALAVSGGALYAGGDFTTAGSVVSPYVAMATPSVPLAILVASSSFGFTNGNFDFKVAGPVGSNVVVAASSDLHAWVPLQTNRLDGGLLYFSDPQSPVRRQRFYRAQLFP